MLGEHDRRRKFAQIKAIPAVLLTVLFAGCATTAPSPSYVKPGMSRQEVIKRLGPPMTVISRDETGVEYLYYRFSETEAIDDVDLGDVVVPIHEGMVLSPEDL